MARDSQHGIARGVPDVPPQTVQVAPKQVLYPSVTITVQPQGDGSRVLVIDTPVGEQLVFPMSVESAKRIGHALSAPGIEVPSQPPMN